MERIVMESAALLITNMCGALWAWSVANKSLKFALLSGLWAPVASLLLALAHKLP